MLGGHRQNISAGWRFIDQSTWVSDEFREDNLLRFNWMERWRVFNFVRIRIIWWQIYNRLNKEMSLVWFIHTRWDHLGYDIETGWNLLNWLRNSRVMASTSCGANETLAARLRILGWVIFRWSTQIEWRRFIFGRAATVNERRSATGFLAAFT